MTAEADATTSEHALGAATREDRDRRHHTARALGARDDAGSGAELSSAAQDEPSRDFGAVEKQNPPSRARRFQLPKCGTFSKFFVGLCWAIDWLPPGLPPSLRRPPTPTLSGMSDAGSGADKPVESTSSEMLEASLTTYKPDRAATVRKRRSSMSERASHYIENNHRLREFCRHTIIVRAHLRLPASDPRPSSVAASF